MNDLPIVRRIETDHGSYIEPPFEESWSELEKLRWHLAVALHDGGDPDIRVGITPAKCGRIVRRATRRRPEKVEWYDGMYGFQLNDSFHSGRSYRDMWDFLNGFSAALRAVRPE